MARRKKASTRRRRKTTVSLTGVAQSLIVSNAMVKGATNANLAEFFTGKVSNPIYLGGRNAYNPITSDSIITLPELLGIDRSKGLVQSGSGGVYSQSAMTVEPSLQLATMKDNIMENWAGMLGTALVVPAVFKLGKRVMTKAGVTRGVNKVFDVAGLKEVRF